MAALGDVAGPDNVAGMIDALLKIKDTGERDDAERAIAMVCARTADEAQRAEPVLAIFRNAAEPQKVLLLPVLGRVGGPKAWDVVMDALAKPDGPMLASGQRALCLWPDATAADELAKLAEKVQDRDMKIRAIQALVRTVVLPGGNRSEDVKLALFVRAMKQAERNDERRMILDRVREAHTFAAVRFAAGYLDTPELSGQACGTIADLLGRGEIRDPNRAESDAILDKLIQVCKDKSLAARAKSFRSSK